MKSIHFILLDLTETVLMQRLLFGKYSAYAYTNAHIVNAATEHLNY